MSRHTRRTFLKYSAAAAGALALPQVLQEVDAHASPSSCLWGAFPDPAAYGGDLIAAVTDFETLIGRKLGMTRHYIRWNYSDIGPGGTPTIPSQAMKDAAAGHRTPFMDWRPQKTPDTGAGYILWSDIAAGKQDAYITSVANAFLAWNKTCYLVFNHEPENDAANNAPGLSMTDAAVQFKGAYKRIHDIFLAVGVTKVKWVCTLVQGTYARQPKFGTPELWTPKAAKFAGVDGYNRGVCSGGWKSFQSLFSGAHDYAVSAGKKMIVEEWGCVDNTASCGDGTHTKAQWFMDAGHTIKSWPEVAAVIYTHVDAAFRGLDVDFRVNSPTGAMSGYQAVGNDPYFGGTGSPIA